MNVGAVSAVGSGGAPVYAALSPYLNGVVRTADAAAAAQLQATAASTSAAAAQAAIAARGAAAAALTAAPPFANPAITAIGERIALGESLTPPAAVTPNALLGAPALTATATTSTPPLSTTTPATPQQPSATDQVLHGDSGMLIQAYGAVALLVGAQALPPVYAQPIAPVIPPVARVTSIPRISKVA